MGKVLVIGAGGVSTVVVHKMASLPQVFTEIMLASRTKSKCDAIAEKIGSKNIQTSEVDADNVPRLVRLIKSFKPDIWILLIMNRLKRLNMRIAGSGLISTNLRKPE